MVKKLLFACFALIGSLMMGLTPNDFKGTDSERIAQALSVLKKQGGGTLRMPRREDADGRAFWLIDEAILLDANTTLIIEDCTIKLSDRCRDNFIRSANCGYGIENVQRINNIRVVGIGNAVLLGADNPRATGDSGKKLGDRTYGTDAGKEGETQTGDWRNIGVLMAYVDGFSVQGISIVDSHCWAMSFEHCTNGLLSHLHFKSTSKKVIGDKTVTMLNQDGIDLRQGCHNIVIEAITGYTGDDLIALTAIGKGGSKAGLYGHTMVGGTIPTDDDDITNIQIRNVTGYSAGRCQVIRFLNTGGNKINHIILDGLIDNSPKGFESHATIRIGDHNPNWGGVTPLGDTSDFIITNVHANSKNCILIAGSLANSIISNVINHYPDCGPVTYESGQDYVKDVIMTNFK
jgi:hypothetical protein